MVAIELASTEGFTRSAADVSLRRLAFYSLSPLLKTAFEQVYGAPFLTRMIFAEVGPTPAEDLFLRVEYDGAITANGPAAKSQPPRSCAISGTTPATELMEKLLGREHDPTCTLNRAMKLALDAWSAGSLPTSEGESDEMPSRETLAQHRAKELESATIEAGVLERSGPSAIRYRALTAEELDGLTS